MADEHACRVCANAVGNPVYPVREMMFGTRAVFDYFQCRRCGCLQIGCIPEKMDRYYPPEYQGFRNREQVVLPRRAFGRQLRRARADYAMYGKGGISGKIVDRLKPLSRPLSGCLQWLALCGMRFDSAVLDVGCGGGAFLSLLDWHGFDRLTGIDPYIPADRRLSRAVSLYKRDIFAQSGRYDLVVFNHSFEHVSCPLETLVAAAGLLAGPGGWMIVRIPTVSSYAWEHYRSDWVQLDAPRHFFLYSLESFRMLAARAGLRVEKVIFDSSEFQFWGSEQYLHDIPHNAANSYAVDRRQSIFTPRQIDEFKSEAARLNSEGRGDQAVIFLKKV